MIIIGRRDRGLCHLGDLIDAPLSIFNGLQLIHHSNSGGETRWGYGGDDGSALGWLHLIDSWILYKKAVEEARFNRASDNVL